MRKLFYLLSLVLCFTAARQMGVKSAPEPDFQSWNMVKSHPVMRIYDGDTKYADLVEKAARQYNSVEPMFAFTDDVESADISIFDFKEAKKDGTEEYGTAYAR